MQDFNLLMYVAFEVAIVLLAVCVFLCFHVTRLKKLIGKFEEKITNLRKSVSFSRKEAKAALGKLAEKEKNKPKKFLDYLDEEIDQTLEYHQSLNPDRDIVLDITPDAPMERQSCSLRHAFLIAEKEARYAGENNQSSWDVLQAKLQQIIQFYENLSSSAQEDEEDEEEEEDVLENIDAQEIDNYKKQIENLENYKKLFFDAEDKWQKAKNQAEGYYQQLMLKSQALDDGGEFEQLLKNYSHSYDEIESLITEGVGGAKSGSSIELTGNNNNNNNNMVDNGAGKLAIANQEEMQRLRNMAVDQHKVIVELKRKLVGAKSPEEQQQVTEQLTQQLTQQLDQQQRFLSEAETCTKLLEDELSRTIQENEQLRSQLESQSNSSSANEEELEKLETMVGSLTSESKEMLRTIAILEQDNQSLKQQIASEAASDTAEESELLKSKLSQLQQELLNMQTQHIELEERYLELKMSSN